MPETATILWLRQDLRLADHPALAAAIASGGPAIPVYVWAPEEEGEWPPGAASRVWLHRSLEAQDAALRARGSRLILRRGESLRELLALARECGAGAVYWSRRYEPAAAARDAKIKDALRDAGREAESFNSALLFEPWTITNASEQPYKVFTPFWRACCAMPDPPHPLPAPERIPAPEKWPTSVTLDSLELLPKIRWDAGIHAAWTPGEQGAAGQLARFTRDAAAKYAEDRNRPDLPCSSRLSPHLHFGEISPRQIWHAVKSTAAGSDPRARSGSRKKSLRHGTDVFLNEIGWREFAYHLLSHFPRTTNEPMRPEFRAFPWANGAAQRRHLAAWQRGRTGYAIVDAGMRELWTTGWMHNRVRMIVASFLVKHLLMDWREGARWFWDTQVDADLASNTLGWQWSAGCGADAAPYFRIFNPVLQGERFDPEGNYVRRWVPELANLAAAWIHRPWEASREELRAAGVELGKNYPRPIVDHAEARQRALDAFRELKQAAVTGAG